MQRATSLLLAIAGCVGAPDTETEPAGLEPLDSVDGPYGWLGRGTRRTLVDGIRLAENLTFSSDGRLFVTGADGLYEIVDDGTGVVEARQLAAVPGHGFNGITEIDGVLYALSVDFLGSSSLYAAALTATPSFREIHVLTGVTLANGLAADAAGHLYVSSSLQGQILRLQRAPEDPFSITAQEVWLSGLVEPNGLKVSASALTFVDLGSVRRAAIGDDGRAGPVTTIVSRFTFFDDLFVDDRGILVANTLAGSLQAFGPNGFGRGRTCAGTFANPSAVVPADARFAPAGSGLIVTERGGGRVSSYRAEP